MEAVKVWEERILISTYEVGEANRNPMFLEKRVYQGSSGVVYPHAVIEKLSDEKVDKAYDVVFLENEYLKIMIMPSLGGRVQMAYDKTNDHHFVYYNQVIKPALVGLTGPWISGGIEFNWPQHHRPSTFDPVDYRIVENQDGSKSVWVSEIERMFRTKGSACFTLHPEKAYLQIDAQLYNRTNEPQTFLWWANPALAVNDDYQTVFPPDVHAVMDHGKRDVSRFPIATGEYYKMDYSAGVDISRYKNIPVPTSYMAYKSEYNFVGGYDHGKEAGMLHVCNHHVSPGKKQWVWGCGDFGQAWDRNLTDEDGPYVELMTGVYTDNQPDFTWLQPCEEKSFTQYFMPYKQIGYAKNVCREGALSLEVQCNTASVGLYTSGKEQNLQLTLTSKSGRVYLDKQLDSSPENPFMTTVPLAEGDAEESLTLTVCYADGREMLSYTPAPYALEPMPEPAQAIPDPENIPTLEELFLAGQHIEQYRHATRLADDYYREALRRDPSDVRANNALGLYFYRRGQFFEAETHFQAAVDKQLRRNPNPYDGEPYYNLGLARRMLGKTQEAFDAFYKATWNSAMQDCAYFQLAQIATGRQDYEEALDCVQRSLIRNWHNHKGRDLKVAILRKSERLEEAEREARLSLEYDNMGFMSRHELGLVLRAQGEHENAETVKQELSTLMRENDNNYLELAIEYMQAGLYAEAFGLLEGLMKRKGVELCSPLIIYYQAYCVQKQGEHDKALELYKLASSIKPDYCFPNKLESIAVLQAAMQANPADSRAPYYLGCLWYGFRQHGRAIACWECSIGLDDSYATAHRNLALSYMNKRGEVELCRRHLEKAFELDCSDARVLFELDQFYKKQNYSLITRRSLLEKHMDIVKDRDDLFLEYVSIVNTQGEHENALKLIIGRHFHPWEGGEGKVPTQYKQALLGLALEAIAQEQWQEAIGFLERCRFYPENLGEGKLFGTQENNIHYYLGIAYEGLGDSRQSRESFEHAAIGLSEPTSAMYYNDQPPHMIFYQGLALMKLGRMDEARSRFNKLIDYGETHIFDHCAIDYFAVSLPDFLVFDTDMNEKNRVHCRYMMALGYLGLGKHDKASAEFEKVLDIESSHIGALTHKDLQI